MTNQIKNLLIIFSFLIIASCDNTDDPPPAKSSEKKITSFKFSGLAPEVTATINETAHTISAIVPAGTDVTALVPTIAVSEKATVSPASATAQNFSSSVTYTVTAEDNTTQAYQVTVTVEEPEESGPAFTMDPYEGSLTIERGDVIYIYGTGFGSADDNSAVFINQADQSEIQGDLSGSTDTQLTVWTKSDFALGEYKLRVSIGEESVILDEIFTVIAREPEIWNVTPEILKAGDDITIEGIYFAASGNVVKLKNSSYEYELTLSTDGAYFIQATLPMDVEPGYYTLSVTAHDREGSYETEIHVISPTEMVIISVDSEELAPGETLIIYGNNLGNESSVTNINFVPEAGGVTLVRTGVSESDGSAVTYDLPSDFPEGSYILIIEVGGEYSNEYETVHIFNP